MKRRAFSLLLSLTLLFSLALPATTAYAEDGSSNKGMEISKTATANQDGSYIITLEAYATGEKVISEITKDVPTDIILVLDQSGSMAEDIGKVSFEQYVDESGWFGETTYHTRNQDYYEYRHNGGSANLWHMLADGSYVSVSVTRQENPYTAIKNGKNNSTSDGATSYWNNRNNLYALVDGEYLKVTVSRTNSNGTYTYTLPDGTQIARQSGSSQSPTFTGIEDNVIYLATADDVATTYTYTYTDSNNNVQTIGTSTGAGTVFSTRLYKRVIGSGGGSKLNALKSAVTSFVNNVNQKALGADGRYGTADDVAHRIAIVGFASNSWNGNTEFLSTERATDYWSANADNYRDALVSACGTNGDVNSRLTTAINRLDASGDTYLEYGMDMANKIFAQYPITAEDTSGRQRVVVVFTDGYPAPSGTNDFKYSMANSAIQNANVSKQTYGATVYTVGVFNTADPTADIQTNFATSDGWSDGWGGSGNNLTEQQEAVAANRYMHYVSSNFPGATSLNQGGSMNPNANPFAGGGSYYLSAADAGSLNNIFKQISNQIESGGSSTTLGSSAVVKDIIAPSFQLPQGATADRITLETYSYAGENTWNKNNDDMGATASIEGGQVSVTGFDFSGNWCGTVTENGNTTYRGNKLEISFKVVPKPGFLGGNDVPTNGDASGVYADASDDSLVKAFAVPTVNVPIATPDFTVNNKTIYEGNSTAVSELYTLPDYNTEENAWKAAYVNVTTTGTTADETVSPTDCTDYTVTVNYAPLTDGSKSEDSGGGTANATTGVSANKTATVHVLHPVVTAAVNDVEKYYGEDYTLGNDAGGSITLDWVDKDTSHANNPAVEGTAPYTKDALNLEYTTTQFAGQSGTVPKNNFDVTVKVKKGSEEVTGATITTTCNIGGSNCTTPDTDGKYTVHVKTCQLTIAKVGGASDEPYVFTVYKDGTKYSEVTVMGGSSETIVELPVGEYSIVEDQGWSWRYPNPSYGSNVTLSATNPNGTITCTNTKTGNFWLNGFSAVVKNIFGIAG